MSHSISDRYLSSGFQGESIDAGLKAMLGDDSIASGTHKCSECAQVFQGRAYANPSNPKLLLCAQHYEKYATKCAGCNKPIFGQYAKSAQDSSKYHPQCFSNEYFCDRCKKPIFGELLTADTKYFHPTCFDCSKCNKKINSKYTMYKGDPYCDTCVSEIAAIRSAACASNSVSIETILKKKEALDKQQELEAFRKNVDKGKENCVGCGEKVESIEGFEWEGSLYHTSCFCCVTCSDIIDMDVGFQKIDNKPVCAGCFKKTSTSNCTGCRKPISGQSVAFSGGRYHPSCFCCSQCGKTITASGFIEKAGLAVCATCARASASTAPATRTVITSGVRTGGFVIDPRTGQKKPTTAPSAANQ